MSVGRLLMELKRLLGDPVSNRDAIERLLKGSRKDVVEYEVLRHYASSKGVVPGELEERVRSRDPRVRCAAASSIDVLFPRTRAGRYLRMLVKDPDAKTRNIARSAARRLELSDVALPDTRYRPARLYHRALGGWNPSGWLFGLHRRVVRTAGMPAKLQRYMLPPLADLSDVLSLLEIADAPALRRLCRAGTASGSPYREFEIDKANGSKRAIAAPRAPLRKVQRMILRTILDLVPLHDAAHGFVRGRSTVTNAKPHLRAAMVIKMDLVDFFPTIHFRRVRGIFQQLGYGKVVAHVLASLSTYRPVLDGEYVVWPGVLPQGAPTSPALANLACRRLDARLAALATKSGGRYTRYADDLTFSFETQPATLGRFLWWVDQICQQEGFSENIPKRRVLRRKSQQRITGVVVNSGLFVPRSERHRFRAILARVKRNGLEAEARGKKNFAAYLRGFAAYVNMVQPELGAKWVRDVKALTKGK